ncbi:protease modulator HflC [Litorimonas sp. RW-G-Af-16]|uniref:protease modulator HflC n=1 Tax=Litorimonas sp. RW-G-Af-16 TaxID=3241168 RepID=UPI00390C42F1
MRKWTVLGVLAGLLVIGFFLCTFIVKQWEQAIVFQFGEAKRVENTWGETADAGLKFKYPWENAVTLDRRNLEVDLKPVELLAADQERLVVDAFVRYRIMDPIRFYEALQTERGAQFQLQSIMDSTLRDVLGRVESPEIISGRRAELMAEIQDVSNSVAKDKKFGVEIIDVRIKRADLPQENAERVFQRMVTQRQQEASGIRAEGAERAQEIRATAQKTATVIRAEAQQKAEIIRGEGDQERNAIYASAYNLDPEFFAFSRSMKAYEKGLGKGTTYVLSPDSDFLSYLDNQGGPRRR